MPNILITHSPCSGGTTLTQELEKKIPYEKRIITYDAARFYLKKNGLNADTITQKQNIEMQTFVIASSIGAIMQATRSNIMAVMDNSLIEVVAYTQDVPMPEAIMDQVYNHLMDYRNHSVAYVIPPIIPLENDGVRHTDNEFRLKIHKRILDVIEAFNIPYHMVNFKTVAYRADEVVHIHKTKYNFQ